MDSSAAMLFPERLYLFWEVTGEAFFPTFLLAAFFDDFTSNGFLREGFDAALEAATVLPTIFFDGVALEGSLLGDLLSLA